MQLYTEGSKITTLYFYSYRLVYKQIIVFIRIVGREVVEMKRIIEYTFILAFIAVFVILFLMLLNNKLD